MPHSTLFAQSITTSLRNLQDQYENVVNFGIKSSIEVIQGVACDLETSLFMVDPSEETLNGKISNHKEMQDLDENVRVLVTELLMNERTVAILRELEQKLIHGEVEPGSANEWFEQKLESQSQISDQNITSNLLYRNFRDSVLKIRKPDETWGAGDDDEEIRMVGSTISIHCPITVRLTKNRELRCAILTRFPLVGIRFQKQFSHILASHVQ